MSPQRLSDTACAISSANLKSRTDAFIIAISFVFSDSKTNSVTSNSIHSQMQGSPECAGNGYRPLVQIRQDKLVFKTVILES